MRNDACLRQAGISLLCAAIGLAGCLPIEEDGADPLPEQVLPFVPVRPPAAAQYAETEPNDTFDDPNLPTFTDSVRIIGDIDTSTESIDLDVYELGSGEIGDRILAELQVDAGSNVQLGIFDQQERLLAYVNPDSWSSGPNTIDLILRESTDQLFAVVAARSSSTSIRPYSFDLFLQPGARIPPANRQTMILNFEGHEGLAIGLREPIDVPPFDAANIDPVFAGQTEIIANRILEKVQEDYEGLNVDIFRSDAPDVTDDEATIIYFGTYDERLLGLADFIDPFNETAVQAAIIYTDTFSLFSVLSPSAEEIAQVLANVASHEAGHLLGLRHTADIHSIMDTTASARQMLLDQWFTIAHLHWTVMPIGVQDSPMLLAWTVGGNAPDPPKHLRVLQQKAMDAPTDPHDFHIDRSQLVTSFRTGFAEQN